jgi:hypothetical protein
VKVASVPTRVGAAGRVTPLQKARPGNIAQIAVRVFAGLA